VSRRPGESAAAWLKRVLAALPPDLDDDRLRAVALRVNGPLGDEQQRLEDDPPAYIDFWRSVAAALPDRPYPRAIYADTLLLTGDTPGAVREMLAAFTADPLLIYRMSGEWRDLMERAGPREWALYRALVVQAAALDDPDNREYVNDQLGSLLADLQDDPELRGEVLRLLQPGSA
jgi:hypothetical protein